MDAAKAAFESAKESLDKAMENGAAAKPRVEEAKKKLDEAMKPGRDVYMAIAQLYIDCIDDMKKFIADVNPNVEVEDANSKTKTQEALAAVVAAKAALVRNPSSADAV